MADYSIWVLEYAQAPKYNVSGIIYGAHNQGHVRLPYGYVVIKGNGHVILVDVGYNYEDHGNALADRFGVQDYHGPKPVLAQIGLKPEDVDTIIVTHAHFDHMGNLGDFPNAHVYLQERELTKSVWAMSLPTRMGYASVAIDPADILKCVELSRQGKLTLVDGDMDDVLPGIDLRVSYDSHTYASMYVVVRNDGARESKDPWVLTGDLIYVYENIEGDGAVIGAETMYTPVGVAIGSQFNLIMTTEAIMKTANYDKRRVVPVHERRLSEGFPSRKTEPGLEVVEVCLASGEKSRVK
jgi:glyoxylase-like metal-dependent hydrolase (beta-lactamase superfamily II)